MSAFMSTTLRFLLMLQALRSASSQLNYVVGTGISDITGPAADVNMMGYAMPEQLASGIHMRLYARAFLFGDLHNERARFVFVNLDACMAAQGVAQEVFRRLQGRYGGLYSADNVAISGTHSHAGPGGYLHYMLYQVTSLGFVRQSFDALVEGIVEAIAQAHDEAAPGQVLMKEGLLLNASVNRSPSAYYNNPPQELAVFPHDTDKSMTLLKVVGGDGKARAALNWFAVHGTSMNNTNALISGDNKGIAEQLMEKWAVENESSGAGAGFISAFAQASVGDTSPNVLGAFCLDTGLPCEMTTSTCNGRNELCVGRGPAWPSDFDSTFIVGARQALKAIELFHEASTKLEGPVQFGHRYLNMDYMQVEASPFNRAGQTCPPAMGFSFAAGTTDGPGAFDFKQGDTRGTLFWRVVRDFLTTPSRRLQECHAQKPILLATGEMNYPYPWQPHVVDISILRLGQLLILAVPGEFTSMAGRRLKHAVRETVKHAWGEELFLVIAGLTNTYSSYITTYEEYQVQRYEGASTIYGPHTLDAYIQEFRRLAQDMVKGGPIDAGTPPPNLLAQQWGFLPNVTLDAAFSPFGAVIRDAVASNGYTAGEDVVEVVFQSANPRNNIRRNGTFLEVQRLEEDSGDWQTVYTDADWSTRFMWSRPFPLSPESTATIQWHIPDETPASTYRIQHYGDHKNLLGCITPFQGTSSSFPVHSRRLPRRYHNRTATYGVSDMWLAEKGELWAGPAGLQRGVGGRLAQPGAFMRRLLV